MLREWRRGGRFHREDGLTIVELSLAAAVMALLAGIFGAVLVSTLTATGTIERESRAVSDLRTVLARIERDIRSAECVSAPATGEADAAISLTTWAGGTRTQVTYTIDDGILARESHGSAGSTVLADNLVDYEEAFSYAGPTTEDPRGRVGVQLRIKLNAGHDAREVSTVLAGRNVIDQC